MTTQTYPKRTYGKVRYMQVPIFPQHCCSAARMKSFGGSTLKKLNLNMYSPPFPPDIPLVICILLSFFNRAWSYGTPCCIFISFVTICHLTANTVVTVLRQRPLNIRLLLPFSALLQKLSLYSATHYFFRVLFPDIIQLEGIMW